MVAAIAFESVVKLVAFLAVGLYVSYGLFDGLADLHARVRALPELGQLLRLEQGGRFAYEQWFALIGLSALSVIFLPRQFQVMVVENVDERHLRRAAWAFPLYLLLINLFVLPIALGGLVIFGAGRMDPDGFVLSLPLAHGQRGLYRSMSRMLRHPSRHLLRWGSRPSASGASVVGTSVTRRSFIVAFTTISIANSIPRERMSSSRILRRSKPRSPQ